MSPSSTRAFAARLAEDDAFRALVAEDTEAALAEFDLTDPGLVPDRVVLPDKGALVAFGFVEGAKKPKPEPTPPAPPEPDRPTPINVQLFDPS